MKVRRLEKRGTGVRLGASEVTVLCLEAEGRMLADADEVRLDIGGAESNVAMLLDPQLPDATGRVMLSLDRTEMPTWEVTRPTRGVELTPIGRPNSVVVSDISIGGARGRVVAHTFDLAGKRAMEALLKRPPRPLLLRPGLVGERYWVSIIGDLKLKCVNPGGVTEEQVWRVEFDWVETDPPAGWA